MDFSIVIVNYNTRRLISECLDSIFSMCAGKDFEVIVIDNASTDDSVSWLQNNFGDRIKLIVNSNNLGFAVANNQGAKIARGEYLFFLNSDTLMAADILPELKVIFQAQPEIAVLAPGILNADGSVQDKTFGNFPTLKYLLGKNLRKLFGVKAAAQSEFQSLIPLVKVDWLTGAALVIRKNIFDIIGGWDEKFFLYLEDVDLCWRGRKLGYQCAINPALTLIHYGGQSLKQNYRKRLHYFNSQDYLFKKHRGLLIAALLRILRWPYKMFICLKTKND